MSNVRGWHSFWLWVSVAIRALVLALVTRSAAAQTDRGTEIIEGALSAEPDQRKGARLYRERCASCHGKHAHGSSDPVMPALAGQQALYLIKQLVDFAEGERTEPEMHRSLRLKSSARRKQFAMSSYLTGRRETRGPKSETVTTWQRANATTKACRVLPRPRGRKRATRHALAATATLFIPSQAIAAARGGHRYSVPTKSSILEHFRSIR